MGRAKLHLNCALEISLDMHSQKAIESYQLIGSQKCYLNSHRKKQKGQWLKFRETRMSFILVRRSSLPHHPILSHSMDVSSWYTTYRRSLNRYLVFFARMCVALVLFRSELLIPVIALESQGTSAFVLTTQDRELKAEYCMAVALRSFVFPITK